MLFLCDQHTLAMHYTIQLATQKARPHQKILKYNQLIGDATPLALHERQIAQPNTRLVIAQEAKQALAWCDTLRWLSQGNYPIWHFPNWETLPFDRFSPDPALCAERLEVMHQLQQSKPGIVITSLETLMQKLPPPSFVKQHVFMLKKHDTINMDHFQQNLCDAGYQMVNQVMSHGEYAIRGAIIDIFPTLSKQAIRIERFDDEIFQLKFFDTDTQQSLEPFERITLLPAKEYPWSPESIETFKHRWQDAFPKAKDHPIMHQLDKQLTTQGMEQYQPLFFDQMASLIDYLPDDAEMVYHEDLHAHAEKTWSQINDRYEQLHGDRTRPLLKPNALYQTVDGLFQAIKSHPQVVWQSSAPSDDDPECSPAPIDLIQVKSKQPFKALDALSKAHRVFVAFRSSHRMEAFRKLCDHHERAYEVVNDWSGFLESKAGLTMAVARAHEAFLLPKAKVAWLPEQELIRGLPSGRAKADGKPLPSQDSITPFSLANLNPGDPIVHTEHGIGHYQGLVSKQLGDKEEEMIQIAYADGDVLYIPSHQIHLIHPYSLVDTMTPPAIHALGSKKWQKQKEQAKKKIHDVATECLEIAAKRQMVEIEPFSLPEDELKSFAETFEYTLTRDQDQAIREVLNDLQKPNPMNRLICGDVGYGKTEVAMHAAFMAACNQKQVAILTPTTLLAEQHTQTFKERFHEWPIQIECLTSFRTTKENSDIKARLAAGQIDIIIGTHSLIQKDMRYADLGLIIIDEEHRFGVRQKNQLKQFKNQAHVLMLTATPIPRTLSQAFSYLSDLSIISTPPMKRKNVKTCLGLFDRTTIQDAVQRELMRGGQVYFLHNRVSDIQKIKARLLDYMPNLSIEIAHGQMPKHTLERIMKAFVNQDFSVLLCTTIIESGIDIPNANTILINRVDKLGLAQLHQLRGRVGRSHHQGFAYLLTERDQALQTDASRRLDAITQSDSLGAGFMLANHDLEIRGAGELLGKEQSGHIDHIGTSMYHELLEKTIHTLESGDEKPAHESPCDIELSESRLLPTDYIADPHSRLVIYKRLSQAVTEQAIDQIEFEIIDRFGVLPHPAINYLQACRLKQAAKVYGIEKIRIYASSAMIQFNTKPHINTGALIQLIQRDPKHYQMRDAQSLRMHFEQTDNAKAIDFILEILNNKLQK